MLIFFLYSKMWSLVTWTGNSLTCLTWQFFWWQVFFQKCKFFEKWLYKHQDLFLKWIRDSGCLPPESCTHPRWSKMSPVCIIGTSDEPLCVPAWPSPPFFFILHALKIVGITVHAKWSFKWNEMGSEIPRDISFLKEVTMLMGRKLIRWFTFFFYLVRLLPLVQGDT